MTQQRNSLIAHKPNQLLRSECTFTNKVSPKQPILPYLPTQLTKRPQHDAPPNRLRKKIATLGNNILAGDPQTLRGR